MSKINLNMIYYMLGLAAVGAFFYNSGKVYGANQFRYEVEESTPKISECDRGGCYVHFNDFVLYATYKSDAK